MSPVYDYCASDFVKASLKVLGNLAVALVTTLGLLSCATTVAKFSPERDGVVAGTVEVVVADLDLYQIQLIARKKNAILTDAINLYLKPNVEHNYQAILAQGEYEFVALRVHTGGLRYLQQQSPLPIGFEVKKKQLTRLGALKIHLSSKEGLLDKMLHEEAKLTHSNSNTELLDVIVMQTWPELPVLPAQDQSLLQEPVLIPLELEGEDSSGGIRFKF